jgi:hypothetical protein
MNLLAIEIASKMTTPSSISTEKDLSTLQKDGYTARL